MRLSKSQKEKVERALDQHDRHRNSYFWSPPTHASGRRSEEKRNTWAVSFVHGGVRYEYHSSVSCSCANYYYRGTFKVDGEVKDRRAFARLLSGQKRRKS